MHRRPSIDDRQGRASSPSPMGRNHVDDLRGMELVVPNCNSSTRRSSMGCPSFHERHEENCKRLSNTPTYKHYENQLKGDEEGRGGDQPQAYRTVRRSRVRLPKSMSPARRRAYYHRSPAPRINRRANLPFHLNNATQQQVKDLMSMVPPRGKPPPSIITTSPATVRTIGRVIDIHPHHHNGCADRQDKNELIRRRSGGGGKAKRRPSSDTTNSLDSTSTTGSFFEDFETYDEISFLLNAADNQIKAFVDDEDKDVLPSNEHSSIGNL